MNYNNFQTNAPTSNLNTILNGATIGEAIAVMDHAAAIWEKAFENSSSSLSWASSGVLTQTISVDWDSHSGDTLATGGTGWTSGTDNPWTSGSLDWDNDTSSTFFVDTTPWDNSEWRQSSQRDINFADVLVNAERVSYDAPAGTARDNSDMLSVAIHEIGHALGFLGGVDGYPLYNAADLDDDNDIDIESGPFLGAEIDILGGHTDFEIASPGNDAKGPGFSDFPYDPGPGSAFANDNYNPSLMAPGGFSGVRNGLTAADIAIVAEYLAFDQSTVNFNPVVAIPEPGTVSLLVIGCGGLALNRRRRRF